MRKAIISLFLALASIVDTNAQNLAFYLELIPEAQLPHLKTDLIKGMVGLYELGQRPAQVPNLLNGVCVLDTLSDSYLSMHTSKVSTLSIKMLKHKADTTSILAVVKSVKAVGTTDSSISFFTNTWSKIATEKYFDLPTAQSFYRVNDKVSLDEFSKYCIPLIIEYKIDDDTISATIDPEKYLPEEVYKQISPAVSKEAVRYVWDGNRYVKN